MMNELLDLFSGMTPWQAAGWLLLENVLLFSLALGLGEVLARLYKTRPVGPAPDPVTGREVAISLSCILGNTLVTIIGWRLWRAGYIVIRRDTGWRAWLDVVVLLFVMDLAMYVLHRIAHFRWIYPIVHRTHHLYDRPRPLDLFVLNPFEVLGFGGLWLLVLWLYPSSWLGIVIYLTLNLLFGMLGHVGVEPFPDFVMNRKPFSYIGSSTFHAGHHHDANGNFGFYTGIWDRLFGTWHGKG